MRVTKQRLEEGGYRTLVEPHNFKPRGIRFWICDACYAPKVMHPREGWVVARHIDDNAYISEHAPHFQEGW